MKIALLNASIIAAILLAPVNAQEERSLRKVTFMKENLQIVANANNTIQQAKTKRYKSILKKTGQKTQYDPTRKVTFINLDQLTKNHKKPDPQATATERAPSDEAVGKKNSAQTSIQSTTIITYDCHNACEEIRKKSWHAHRKPISQREYSTCTKTSTQNNS